MVGRRSRTDRVKKKIGPDGFHAAADDGSPVSGLIGYHSPRPLRVLIRRRVFVVDLWRRHLRVATHSPAPAARRFPTFRVDPILCTIRFPSVRSPSPFSRSGSAARMDGGQFVSVAIRPTS